MYRNLLLVLAVGFGSAVAASATRQAGAQESASQDQTDRAAAKVQSLDLRYAEIVEQIAEVNLRKARDTNARVPGTIADTDVQRLKENLRLARRDVQQLKESPQSTGGDDRLREARARANMAEAELRKARAANRRSTGAVADIELQRLQLEFEAAQINVARQQAAADVPGALAELREQIGDLRKEITRLQRQLRQIAGNRSSKAPAEVRTAADSKD